MRGIDELNLPHSRFNGVDPKSLQAAGYSVLANAPKCGWTVAVGERGRSRLVLLQGHPEYTQLTPTRQKPHLGQLNVRRGTISLPKMVV
jgi:homoserine trans-succinylase